MIFETSHDPLQSILGTQPLGVDAMLPENAVRVKALSLAAWQKIPVFPVNPEVGTKKSKTPWIYGGSGYKDATLDLKKINEWWSDSYRGAMIGYPTGQASGIVVLDLDVSKGKQGYENFLQILAEEGEVFPDTRTIRTPSGGTHMQFIAPDEIFIPISAGALGDGIDIRGDGGYAIADGSWNKDYEGYELIHDVEMVPLPAFLIERILKAKRTKASVFSGGKLPNGSRNSNLTKILGALRAQGMDEEGLIKTGLFINKEFAVPPLDESEVVQIAKSIGSRPRSYSFDVIGNAERFVDRYSKHVKCCNGKEWYVWKDGLYTPDRIKLVQEFAKQIAKDLDGEAKHLEVAGNEGVLKALVKLAKNTKNNPLSMLQIAASDPKISIDADQFDQDLHLLNCKNCIVNLDTGAIINHDPQYLFTKQTTAAYNPEATAPIWADFLNYTTDGDQEFQAFLARLYGGVGLHGSNSEQIMAILFGFGKNGKSLFAETIRFVSGSYADAMRPELLMAKSGQNMNHDKAEIKGSRFIFASEPPAGSKLNGSMVKELTGGDMIKARQIYQSSVTFKCQGLITLISNWEPEVEAGDAALKRRLLFIEFSKIVPEERRDPNLAVKLQAEADGILTWLVKGRMDYLKNGLAVPKKILERTLAFNTEMDFLEQFISEKCSIEETAKVQAEPLWAAYQAYMFSTHPRDIGGSFHFYKLLKRRFSCSRINGKSHYHGLSLK